MDTDDLLQQALEMHRRGDVPGAMRVYQQILEAEPGHFAARLNLASIALDNRKLPEAQKLLDELIGENDASGVAHLLRARVAFLQNNLKLGSRHIARAHELLPDDEGVTGEYVSAMRRAYFAFDREEYDILRQAERANSIKPASRQRLAHLALSRLVRPELISLLTAPDLEQDSPDAVTRWQQKLPLDARNEVTLLAADLADAFERLKDLPRLAPQRANVQMRRAEGQPEREPVVCEEFTDVDSLTGASLELVRHDNLEFVPFSEIASVEFATPALVTDAFVTLRGGRTISGLCPLFYLLTEFASAEKVRQGRVTLFRALMPGLICGVGMRSFKNERGLLPMTSIERIEFKGQ